MQARRPQPIKIKKTVFGKKQPVWKKKLPGGALFLVLLAVMAGSVFFMLRSESFFVRKTTFQGLRQLKQSQVEEAAAAALDQTAALAFKRRNVYMLFLSRAEIARDIKRRLPLIKEVTITINDWRAPWAVFNFTERSEKGLWCQASPEGESATTSPIANQTADGKEKTPLPANCFFYDETGKLFKPAPATQGKLLPVVIDRREKELRLGNRVLPEQVFRTVQSIIKKVGDLRLHPALVNLDPFVRDVRVTLGEDWSILLDPGQDLDRQFETLRAYLAAEGQPPAQYADLRIAGRVYAK